jgi:hypothetical protein
MPEDDRVAGVLYCQYSVQDVCTVDDNLKFLIRRDNNDGGDWFDGYDMIIEVNGKIALANHLDFDFIWKNKRL